MKHPVQLFQQKKQMMQQRGLGPMGGMGTQRPQIQRPTVQPGAQQEPIFRAQPTGPAEPVRQARPRMDFFQKQPLGQPAQPEQQAENPMQQFMAMAAQQGIPQSQVRSFLASKMGLRGR